MKFHKHQGFFSVDMKNKRYTVILKATLLGCTTFQLSTNLSISSCCSIYALRLTANSKTKEASINFDLKLVLYSFFLHFFCVFFFSLAKFHSGSEGQMSFHFSFDLKSQEKKNTSKKKKQLFHSFNRFYSKRWKKWSFPAKKKKNGTFVSRLSKGFSSSSPCWPFLLVLIVPK